MPSSHFHSFYNLHSTTQHSALRGKKHFWTEHGKIFLPITNMYLKGAGRQGDHVVGQRVRSRENRQWSESKEQGHMVGRRAGSRVG